MSMFGQGGSIGRSRSVGHIFTDFDVLTSCTAEKDQGSSAKTQKSEATAAKVPAVGTQGGKDEKVDIEAAKAEKAAKAEEVKSGAGEKAGKDDIKVTAGEKVGAEDVKVAKGEAGAKEGAAGGEVAKGKEEKKEGLEEVEGVDVVEEGQEKASTVGSVPDKKKEAISSEADKAKAADVKTEEAAPGTTDVDKKSDVDCVVGEWLLSMPCGEDCDRVTMAEYTREVLIAPQGLGTSCPPLSKVSQHS